ncbi:hypothetical protein HMSSN036_85040 [Paenibacillus macerans]|nr:hypothetical protein HMSSN036_85040 [Paenibacillus macerans]
MTRMLAFTSSLLLFSGVILLLVDKEIYRLAHMKKEQRSARVLGWAEIVLSIAGFLAFLLLRI